MLNDTTLTTSPTFFASLTASLRTIHLRTTGLRAASSSIGKIKLYFFVIGVVFMLGACTIHKIDVQQGNIITQELLEKLKIGMGKQKVQRLLGTPLIDDPFRKNRWDYIYSFVSGVTNEKQSSHVSLYFEGDTLQKIDVLKPPIAEADVKKTTILKR